MREQFFEIYLLTAQKAKSNIHFNKMFCDSAEHTHAHTKTRTGEIVSWISYFNGFI